MYDDKLETIFNSSVPIQEYLPVSMDDRDR